MHGSHERNTGQYAAAGDKILDTHAGSGACLQAAYTEQGIIFWVLRSKKTISRKQTNACGKKWRKCVLIFFSGGIRQHERKRRGSRRHKIRRTLKTEKERRKNDRFGSGNPKQSSRTKLKIKPVIIIRFVRQKVKENGGILTAVTTC